MDFKQYLLNELYSIANELGLDNKIEVAEFRSFEMPEDKTTLLFVIRYITGNYVGDIKTQPLQIFCYSELNDSQSAYLILDSFSKKHNNYQTDVDNEWIKMNFETPVSMRNFIQSEVGYRASVYCFGTYVELKGISDIKSIMWEGNKIPYLTGSFGYSAVLNTSKLTGDQLSKSIKQEAGLTFNMTLMKTNSDFCQLIEDIMLGNESGNYNFEFTFTKTDNSTFTLTLKLEQITLPTDKTSAPMYTLSFRR